jgi:transcriptional regulator with XRE-family HTH domain
LRKKVLEITQAEFAKRIGLKHSVVSQWEVGITPLNEKNIKLICHIFKVNEEWLRHGKGEVFIAEGDPILQEIMELVEKMDEPERQVVLNYVRWYISEQQTLAGKAPPPAREDTITTSVKNPDITIKKRPCPAESEAGGAAG